MRDRVRTRQGRFAQVPLWLLTHRAVKDGAIRLFGVLAAKYADRDDDSCFPSRRALAEDLDVSRSTIDVAIGQLKDAGALVVEQQRDERGNLVSSLYTLLFDDPDAPPLHRKSGRGVDRKSGVGVDRKSGVGGRPKNKGRLPGKPVQTTPKIRSVESTQNQGTQNQRTHARATACATRTIAAARRAESVALRVYAEAYAATHGVKATITRRDREKATTLDQDYPADRLAAAIRVYLESDGFYADRGHPFALFASNAAMFLATGPTPAPAATGLDAVLAAIEALVNRHTYYTWFRPLRQVGTRADGTLVVEAEPPRRAWIEKHYAGEWARGLAAARAQVEWCEQPTA
jgi:biotin operon repressor